jgi:pimeloyl-ACP methyl ester carboxylesterase
MEAKRIRLAAGEIPYLSLGEGPDLLFLHGAIATSEAYIPLLTRLSRTYHVIAPTHPGHGSAFPIPRDWKLTDFIRFYENFLVEISCTPKLVIGHSFGGTIALLLASKGIGSHVIVMDSPGLPFQFELTEYTKALLEEARDVIQKRPDLDRLIDMTKATGTLFQTVIQHPDAPSLFTKQGPKFNIYRELKQITIPVDILWGEDDRVVPVAVGKQIQQCIPHSRLVVFPHRGHGYSVTDPEFTYEELMKVI